MKEIKFFVMDVDGTLTDGKIYMSDSGELCKAFNIKDGCGIKEILPKRGIIPVIITARSSELLRKRCAELDIAELHQGVRGKLDRLREIIAQYSSAERKYGLSDVLYVGDDLMDIPCMQAVKSEGGLVACPADAIPEICAISDMIAQSKAGEGAIREIIERLTDVQDADSAERAEWKVQEALRYLHTLDLKSAEPGTYPVSDDFYYIIKEISSSPESECIVESHQQYIDIQWVIEGEEITKLADVSRLKCKQAYNAEQDFMLWEKQAGMSSVYLTAGSYVVIYPGTAHMPMIAADMPQRVKLLVGKVKY